MFLFIKVLLVNLHPFFLVSMPKKKKKINILSKNCFYDLLVKIIVLILVDSAVVPACFVGK